MPPIEPPAAWLLVTQGLEHHDLPAQRCGRFLSHVSWGSKQSRGMLKTRMLSREASHTRAMLYLVGGMLVLGGALYFQSVLKAIDPATVMIVSPWNITNHLLERHRVFRLQCCIAGLGFIGLALLSRKVHVLDRILAKKPTIALAICAVVITPLVYVDFALRVLFHQETRIFLEDKDLGWRLKPNVEGEWGRTKVRINGKGLRGPELSYEKPPGVRRILFLGDSVTFGFFVEYKNTFPLLTGKNIEKKTGFKVEVINAGVGGYSPWQHKEYWVREGHRYSPDLVIISFVLNDVTEKFGLDRFGAPFRSPGYQLAITAESSVVEKSGIRSWLALHMAGDDDDASPAQPLSEMYELNAFHLSSHSSHALVEYAWKVTTKNLDELVASCNALEVPVALVAFPMVFQEQDARADPQERLKNFAAERNIPYLDLLPPLEQRANGSIQKFFLDEDHISPIGAPVVASLISEFVLRNFAADW